MLFCPAFRIQMLLFPSSLLWSKKAVAFASPAPLLSLVR
jgi:hypothetical protein